MNGPKESLTNIYVKKLNGESIDLLEEYSGQALLLLFYNNQCLGCTGRAIPLAYEFSLEFKNIQVVGIHSNFSGEVVSEKEIKSIFTSGEVPFPIFLDDQHELYDFFLSEGTPYWVLIDKNAQVFRSIFGSQSNSKNRLYYALENLAS
ncbi:redoxin domain-containing protein [Flavicella sp.]|uniref:TlpA family protein disulfide reductase n=1 Tax=Flavicella sp. TaxID=2957742 RepID=UPI00260982BB|nr:redoxin domain-containing protein [Flavicella sp.]MDG1804191.1 redoxin domain-containing protein [Flavicella sp.]MDG2280924.1 redoxin domain-containing protein [Flavicella sp.]